MRITFEETLSRKEWIYSELMNSLTGDIITNAREKGFYEVKLLVDGVELEPMLLNKLLTNIEKYIDNEAKAIVNQKFIEAENKINQLTEIFNDAKYKIQNDFGLDSNDYND